MTSDHARWEELAVGHALDALEPEDSQAFTTHLPGCALCARTVGETAAVMAQLAYAAEPSELPQSLWASILDGVRRSERPAVFPPVAQPAQSRRRAPATRHPSPSRWHSAQRLAPWARVAAGLLLVLALGLWNITLQVDNGAKDDAAGRLTTVLQRFESPSTKTVPLSSATDGKVKGVAVIDAGHVWLVVEGLPRNDTKSTTYVLWQRSADGSAKAVDAFDVVTDGVDVQDVGPLPAQLAPEGSFAVTKEVGRSIPAQPGIPPLASGTVRS